MEAAATPGRRRSRVAPSFNPPPDTRLRTPRPPCAQTSNHASRALALATRAAPLSATIALSSVASPGASSPRHGTGPPTLSTSTHIPHGPKRRQQRPRDPLDATRPSPPERREPNQATHPPAHSLEPLRPQPAHTQLSFSLVPRLLAAAASKGRRAPTLHARPAPGPPAAPAAARGGRQAGRRGRARMISQARKASRRCLSSRGGKRVGLGLPLWPLPPDASSDAPPTHHHPPTVVQGQRGAPSPALPSTGRAPLHTPGLSVRGRGGRRRQHRCPTGATQNDTRGSQTPLRHHHDHTGGGRAAAEPLGVRTRSAAPSFRRDKNRHAPRLWGPGRGKRKPHGERGGAGSRTERNGHETNATHTHQEAAHTRTWPMRRSGQNRARHSAPHSRVGVPPAPAPPPPPLLPSQHRRKTHAHTAQRGAGEGGSWRRGGGRQWGGSMQ